MRGEVISICLQEVLGFQSLDSPSGRHVPQIHCLTIFFFFFLRKRESFSEPLLAWLAQPCRNFIKSHQGNRCGGELKWGCFRKMAGEALTEHIFMSKPPGGAVPMGLGGAGDSAFLTSSQVRLLPPGVPQPKALSKRCLPQWWLLEPPDDWMGAPE